MRSISDGWCDQAKSDQRVEVTPKPEYAYQGEPACRDAAGDPCRVAQAKEELRRVYSLFAGDTVAIGIIDHLGKGVPSKETQRELNISHQEYERVLKHIRRSLDASYFPAQNWRGKCRAFMEGRSQIRAGSYVLNISVVKCCDFGWPAGSIAVSWLFQMLRLLALTCLLLLAMPRLLDGFAPVQFESLASVDVNVAPEAVNTGCRGILVADFEVHSEDVAAASHHGPSALRGYGGERRTLILSVLKAIRENEISKDRTGGNVRVFLRPPQILNQAWQTGQVTLRNNMLPGGFSKVEFCAGK
jgi:hypothetical protein